VFEYLIMRSEFLDATRLIIERATSFRPR